MRIVFLGNNWLGWQTLKWLRDRGEDVVALVIHPEERRKYGDELLAVAGLDSTRVFEAPQLKQPETVEVIRALRPDIGVSVLFGSILRKEFIELFPAGCINIHPGLLPHNRGANPNVWSIVERTPAGVTIHCIDEGVDTGDVLAQAPVAVDPVDTGKTLYHKLEEAAFRLFTETWPAIRAGTAVATPQDPMTGSCHRLRDVEQIDAIELDRRYTAWELIDVLRARTFAPYPGAYFEKDGRRVYLRLELLDEQDLHDCDA